MGIFDMMRTSISGMHAQANRLSAISDNVANASTIGYKRAQTEFSTLVLRENVHAYQSGGVETNVSHQISMQGIIRGTGAVGDMAISGNGFFIVSDRRDGSGSRFLTRAGDFRPDKDGFLRNSAGFYLLDASGNAINVGSATVGVLSRGKRTDKVNFKANLPSTVDPVKEKKFDPLEKDSYTYKTSTTVIGAQGEPEKLDVYFRKTAKNTWEVVAIGSDKDGKPLPPVTTQLQFDEQGNLTTKGATLNVNVVGQPVTLDLSHIIISGSEYVVAPVANGLAAGSYQAYEISEDGDILIHLTNGEKLPKGHINLATVSAVDRLTVCTGTVFQENSNTGPLIFGRPNHGVFGKLGMQELEEANVDIATELTDMIQSQRSYTANSKVFQTGAEVMDVTVNLKR